MEYPTTDWQTVTDQQMIDIALFEAYHSFRSTIETTCPRCIGSMNMYRLGNDVAIQKSDRDDVEYAIAYLEKNDYATRLGADTVAIHNYQPTQTGATA